MRRILRNKANSGEGRSEGKCFTEKGLWRIRCADSLGKTKPMGRRWGYPSIPLFHHSTIPIQCRSQAGTPGVADGIGFVCAAKEMP